MSIQNRLHSIFHSLTDTPFGGVAVLWAMQQDVPKIYRVLLSKPDIPALNTLAQFYPDSRQSSCSEIEIILFKIQAFLNGENVRFSLDAVRLDLCTFFQQRVLTAEYGIPRGQVSTYRLIAKHLNNPTGARAVGTALATNPFPIIIPCHRAIRSDGSLGGYQGGLKMKRSLLEMEGIAFLDSVKVSEINFYYNHR